MTSSKPVSEEYPKLYHYTTWGGVQGIIKTQRLWATHARFLNDYSEIVGFKPKLVEDLQPVVRNIYEMAIRDYEGAEQYVKEAGGLDAIVAQDTTDMVDVKYKAARDEFYVCSFCSHGEEPQQSHGLLSQWRGYGSDGGFALVFGTKGLEELLMLEGKRYEYRAGHFSSVVYSDNEAEYKKEMDEDLSRIAKAVEVIFLYRNGLDKNIGKNDVDAAVEESYVPFVNCISRWKHWGFKEENEVRAVFSPGKLDEEYRELAKQSGRELGKEKEIKWGLRKPYIEVFDSDDMILPIERIIVGPSVDKEARAKALCILLRDTDIEVTISDIPYVG